jgi:uncharacterized protein
MAQTTDLFDLGRLQLSSGEARRLDLEVGIDSLSLAGQRYSANPAVVPAKLDVSRTRGGYSLRLRYEVRLAGPCMRCVEDAVRTVDIDSREVDQPGEGDEELDSPYVEQDELNLRDWARDALVLELPAQIVCTEDCRGLCADCGENLNQAGPDHAHEAAPDPRWAKLGELRLE